MTKDASIRAETRPVKGGHMLYDAARADHIRDHVFALSYWRARNALSDPLGGRGAAWRLRDDNVDWVLRFYRRGGLPGKFILDRYFYTGLERTRAWREWRLLADAWEQGLPVPRPVAARVLRSGAGYQAAIITETVPGTPLAALLDLETVTGDAWRAIGLAIRRLHDAGVWHADLNAHNILVGNASSDTPRVFVIDFDRGRIRPQDTAWRRANLARLRRSLHKVMSGKVDAVERGWQQLEAGYLRD